MFMPPVYPFAGFRNRLEKLAEMLQSLPPFGQHQRIVKRRVHLLSYLTQWWEKMGKSISALTSLCQTFYFELRAAIAMKAMPDERSGIHWIDDATRNVRGFGRMSRDCPLCSYFQLFSLTHQYSNG